LYTRVFSSSLLYKGAIKSQTYVAFICAGWQWRRFGNDNVISDDVEDEEQQEDDEWED
jgi:hypothetical protein